MMTIRAITAAIILATGFACAGNLNFKDIPGVWFFADSLAVDRTDTVSSLSFTPAEGEFFNYEFQTSVTAGDSLIFYARSAKEDSTYLNVWIKLDSTEYYSWMSGGFKARAVSKGFARYAIAIPSSFSGRNINAVQFRLNSGTYYSAEETGDSIQFVTSTEKAPDSLDLSEISGIWQSPDDSLYPHITNEIALLNYTPRVDEYFDYKFDHSYLLPSYISITSTKSADNTWYGIEATALLIKGSATDAAASSVDYYSTDTISDTLIQHTYPISQKVQNGGIPDSCYRITGVRLRVTSAQLLTPLPIYAYNQGQNLTHTDLSYSPSFGEEDVSTKRKSVRLGFEERATLDTAALAFYLKDSDGTVKDTLKLLDKRGNAEFDSVLYDFESSVGDWTDSKHYTSTLSDVLAYDGTQSLELFNIPASSSVWRAVGISTYAMPKDWSAYDSLYAYIATDNGKDFNIFVQSKDSTGSKYLWHDFSCNTSVSPAAMTFMRCAVALSDSLADFNKKAIHYWGIQVHNTATRFVYIDHFAVKRASKNHKENRYLTLPLHHPLSPKTTYQIEPATTANPGIKYEYGTFEWVNWKFTTGALSQQMYLTHSQIYENRDSAFIGVIKDSLEKENTYTLDFQESCAASNNSSFFIRGDSLFTKVALDYETQNTYSVCVLADDSETKTRRSFLVTVLDTNDAPVATGTIQDTIATEDAYFRYEIADSIFTDQDGDKLSFTASLAKSSDLPSWLTFDSLKLVFYGTPRGTDIGEKTIYVIATDPDGLADTLSFNLSIHIGDDITVTVYPDSVSSKVKYDRYAGLLTGMYIIDNKCLDFSDNDEDLFDSVIVRIPLYSTKFPDSYESNFIAIYALYSDTTTLPHRLRPDQTKIDNASDTTEGAVDTLHLIIKQPGKYCMAFDLQSPAITLNVPTIIKEGAKAQVIYTFQENSDIDSLDFLWKVAGDTSSHFRKVKSSGTDTLYLDTTNIGTRGALVWMQAFDGFNQTKTQVMSIQVRLDTLASDSVFKPDEYDLVSLPYLDSSAEYKNLLSTIFEKFSDKRWRAFTLDDTNFREIGVDTAMKTLPGSAIFLRTQGIKKKLYTTNHLTFALTDTLKITLHPGWNAISSPYDFEMSWAILKSAAKKDSSNIEGPYRYLAKSESWLPPDSTYSLAPWVGYLVRNNDSVDISLTLPNMQAMPGTMPDSMGVPGDSAGGQPPDSLAPREKASVNAAKTLRWTLHQGCDSSSVFAGIAKEDKIWSMPPTLSRAPVLSLKKNGSRLGIFQKDADSLVWTITASNLRKNSEAELTLDVPESKATWIIDEKTSRVTQYATAYPFTVGNETSRTFSVVISETKPTLSKANAIITAKTEPTLDVQNGAILWFIPDSYESETVRISIADIRGRTQQNLVQELESAGSYSLKLPASLARTKLFAVLQIGGHTYTHPLSTGDLK